MRKRGIVKWFDQAKGFGFIVLDGKDVFAHYTAIDGDGFKVLQEGQEVEFDLIAGDRGPQANHITLISETVLSSAEVAASLAKVTDSARSAAGVVNHYFEIETRANRTFESVLNKAVSKARDICEDLYDQGQHINSRVLRLDGVKIDLDGMIKGKPATVYTYKFTLEGKS